MIKQRFLLAMGRHVHEYVLYCIPLVESPHIIILAGVGFVILLSSCAVFVYMETKEH